MIKKVVISCGPIPARLDSVKFLTNRFKGGLAFKTASYLIEQGFDVTIVKWQYTELPESLSNCEVINVKDVFDYYNWYLENASNYNAFIMAAAVANLTPSNPYEGKFPSHNYKVGEQFDIKFEIAPRSIDIIKKVNPKSCLIGYKLFDAKTEQELIEVAKHTLNDSKANIIFANTPKDAKVEKIALTLDGTIMKISFDEHLEMMKDAINQEYFKTEIVEPNINQELENKVKLAYEIVNEFEKTIDGYGTIAIKIDDKSFVTTNRGHRGEPVYVSLVDIDNMTVYANKKATLNAPALAIMLQKYDYVIHRHSFDKKGLETDKYVFPGTKEEANIFISSLNNLISDNLIEKNHGYVKGYFFKDVDWDNYYNDFPKRYFKKNDYIEQMIETYKDKDVLEVGSNSKIRTKYILDPNNKNSNINYSNLSDYQFDLIVIENAINYLSEAEINLLIKSLRKDGLIVANTFKESPKYRIRENEAVYTDKLLLHHYVILDEEKVLYHTFYNRGLEEYNKLGFDIEEYSEKSIIVKYIKN